MSDIKTTTFKRILSAVIALPLYIFCFATDIFYSIPILIVSLIISLLCLFEYYSIATVSGKKPFMSIGIAAGIIVNIIMYLYGFGKTYGFNRYVGFFDAKVIIAVISLFIIIIAILQIFRRPIEGGIYSLAVTVFGVVYIVLSFSHIILLKALKDGIYYIIIVNVVVMLNDIFAYFGGIFFGKHKTNFPVSPNKSWEGYFSGLLFSIIGFIVVTQIFEVFYGKILFSFIEAVILGIFLSVFGHIGDLIESSIKRDGSIKDSGSIVPGHGGMWDVFDALIFVLPMFYYYLIAKGVQ